VTDSRAPLSGPRYAGLLPRLAAILIDLLIAWIVLAVATNVIVPGAIGNDPTAHETATLGLITLIVITAWFNYLVICEWRWGHTLGKRALGVVVADQDGGGLTWNRSVVRNLLLVVDVITGLVLIPASSRHQRLGDRLAHTVVLAKARPRGAGGSEGRPAAPPPPSAPPPAPPPPPAEPARPWSGPGSGDPQRSWGPGRVAVGILALLLTTVFEVGIVSVFDPGLNSLAARLATQALLAATLVGVAFVVTADSKRGIAPPAALGLRRPLRSPFGIAAAAYLGYVVMALVYSSLVHPHQRDITRDLGFGHGGLGTVAAGLLIVIAAPVSEEIFFRGFIFGGIRRRLSFPPAALISATIFGLFHYTGAGSIGVVPQLAFLGFALCWVYEETGSIYPTMAIHAINNAIAFTILTS
jgi:membrane protease YdiL (CAAX protease family)